MNLTYNPVTWATRRLLWRFGFDLCSYPNLPKILQQYSVVIDAGASTGTTRDWLRSFNYTGEIISFEANPIAYKAMLQRHGSDTKWYRHNECLCSIECKALFGINKTAEFSRINGDGTSIVVYTRRLDSLLNPLDIREIFLKTDCEGNDLNVVIGMGKHLSRVGHVLMEISTTARHQQDLSFEAVIKHMAQLGFRVAFVLGNIWNSHKTRADAMDVLFERIIK